MLRLTCPRCNEDSYSASVEAFCACHHCGFVFSGKYGPEKREEKRLRKETSFLFPYKGQNLEASTIDYSANGIGVRIQGNHSITEGDVIDLTIGNFYVKAQIIWVSRKPEESAVMAGLKMLN
ncbi:MAG: PilZ domain-containing protein [Nitrospirota bacterium]